MNASLTAVAEPEMGSRCRMNGSTARQTTNVGHITAPLRRQRQRVQVMRAVSCAPIEGGYGCPDPASRGATLMGAMGDASSRQELWVCHLGTVEYRAAVEAQEHVRALRQAD